MASQNKNTENKLLDIVFKLLNVIICLMILVAALVYTTLCGVPEIFQIKEASEAVNEKSNTVVEKHAKPDVWMAPDTNEIPDNELGEKIRYGKKLIANTAYYLGPNGIVQHLSNGMNCQNCHLDTGTKPFGNNYSAVAANYPKFRERSGMIENIYKRVNDCFERSLNGKSLDTLGKEMQAIKEYIMWLGADVKKGEKPKGAGIVELAFIDRSADPEKGKMIYKQKCKTCHMENGEGKMNADNLTYQYPPLWGAHSYNTGAGLYRLSRFAGYVKANMPLGANYDSPQLTDEEAWDVAAFVNSQDRPVKDLSKDWPKIESKPFDHPFGPYADKFTEEQHKYGPFGAIAEFKKKQKSKQQANNK